ncbi:MAG: hypothetical protein MUE41_01970 [Gemmatimonadaceae bacterium]|nr:hypothetical protein [Gemmatimonadaceae bacterium]
MSRAVELFRFVASRRLERVEHLRLALRLVKDRRPVTADAVVYRLFGPGRFADQLAAAEEGADSDRFVKHDDPDIRAFEWVVALLRHRLRPGVSVMALIAEIEQLYPPGRLLFATPPDPKATAALVTLIGRLWDSVYVQVIRGTDRFIRTNYLADALRAVHVMQGLWVSRALKVEQWRGWRFDEYDLIITIPEPIGKDGQSSGRTARRTAAAPTAAATSAGAQGGFHVTLDTGAIRPPAVGDLLLVEEEVRRYELGEIASITNVLKSEKREFSTRDLSRAETTTSFETESETTESESRSTSEQFQLSTEAQKAAESSMSASIGVTLSSKFGPVQTGVSANASFSQSKSSSEAMAQEFAREVTEEASKSVRSLVRQSTTTTLLTESERTSLHGFDNATGADHIVGIYRWVDRIVSARTVNYGRRLLLTFDVPEPAAFFRSVGSDTSAAATADLVEPRPPADYRFDDGQLVVGGDAEDRLSDASRLTRDNYLALAAAYGVANIEPPPPNKIVGTKAISVPGTGAAAKVEEHGTEGGELSLVTADNTLTVDPAYRVRHIGVWASEGEAGNLRKFADVLKLGSHNKDVNHILVQVASKSFFLTVKGNGDDDPKTVDTNFNQTQEIADDEHFYGLMQPALPITIQADFEGILTITVSYSAYLRDEAFEAWQVATFGAILAGYERLRVQYETARTAAELAATATSSAQVTGRRPDQYRAIERTELKRACVSLLTRNSAPGYGSLRGDGSHGGIAFEPRPGDDQWRAPLDNGMVAGTLESSFEWDQFTYTFLPYFWTAKDRWPEVMQGTSDDPTFEAFLQAGMAQVIVPVRPGCERPILRFLREGVLWCGAYLPLFEREEDLEVYQDVEQGVQFDPPVQVGESWEVRLPTSLIMLQADATLPEFPGSWDVVPPAPLPAPAPSLTAPF